MNFQTATMSELVNWYNLRAERPVKRFSDRKTAERRCAELAAELAAPQLIARVEPETETEVAENPYKEGTTSAALFDALKAHESAKSEGVHGYEHHGQVNCPHCGTHLGNGVGEHMQEVNGTYVKHDKFQYECLACGEEFGPEIKKRDPAEKKTIGPRPAMVESLKLDRRIVNLETNEVYANACRVWKAGLVSSAQGDRLSAELYRAAKSGDLQKQVTVNGRRFALACGLGL